MKAVTLSNPTLYIRFMQLGDIDNLTNTSYEARSLCLLVFVCVHGTIAPCVSNPLSLPCVRNLETRMASWSKQTSLTEQLREPDTLVRFPNVPQITRSAFRTRITEVLQTLFVQLGPPILINVIAAKKLLDRIETLEILRRALALIPGDWTNKVR